MFQSSYRFAFLSTFRLSVFRKTHRLAIIHTNYGTFVPTYFRSQERKYHSWNFRSRERKLHGTFAPWNFRSQKLSFPGNFAPVPIREITVALSTKECSSLPTNVALQSVLTYMYRHVRRTYDSGWHGIGKDYEVVIERNRIDKLTLGHSGVGSPLLRAYL